MAEEIDYESDPEEVKMSLKLRRREASDDEEEGAGGVREKPPWRINHSDGESEGAAAEYGDGFEEEEGNGEDYDLDEEYAAEIGEEEVVVHYEESDGGREDTVKVVEGKDVEELGELFEDKDGANDDDDGEGYDENQSTEAALHEEGKKEIEPYAVPTAGAFYMHDDRFRDNARGRHRRMLGGRKLWESKDDMKWGHDKFEELTIHERRYEENRRGSRGRYRGRGRNRAADHGYVQGNRHREPANNGSQNNKDHSKSVRGRGPQRYQPSFKKKEATHTQNKQLEKSVEKPFPLNSVRTSESMPSAEPNSVLHRKLGFASNLNIASPPFYPSNSSKKDNNEPSRSGDVQAGYTIGNAPPSVVGDSFTKAQSSGMLAGRTIDSSSVDKHVDHSIPAVAGKPSNTVQMPRSGSLSINATQQQLRGQVRGIASLTQMTYQPSVSNNRDSSVQPPNRPQTGQRPSGQNHSQTSLLDSGQQFIPCIPSGPQASPPKDSGPMNTVDSEDQESPLELSKSKTSSVPNGNGGGRGSFLYGGAQVIGRSGNMGSGHGDQNFPAFLPVMQFGGQHPGGIGVPAVGMAFPGYVGQPQLGLGNSEMTWLPVLAGAAGALGARYSPPYVAVDGSYHAHSYGEMSSDTAVSSKESNATNSGDDRKPTTPGEVSNNKSSQRQKNPRRYTAMKFDQ